MTMEERNDALTKEIMRLRELEREWDALRQDAMRYRWLRGAKFLEIVTDSQMFRVAGGDNLDKTVDVAATP